MAPKRRVYLGPAILIDPLIYVRYGQIELFDGRPQYGCSYASGVVGTIFIVCLKCTAENLVLCCPSRIFCTNIAYVTAVVDFIAN